MLSHYRYLVLFILIFACFASVGQDCDKPFVLPVLNKGWDSIEVRWFDNGDADSFEIRYAEIQNALPADPQFIGITSTSFTLTALEPGQQYQFQVRAVCDEERSGWSNKGRASTQIIANMMCSLYLPLRDNNCSFSSDQFDYIELDAHGNLGQDNFIDEVALMIEHPWPADLKIILQSPAGKQMTLVEHVQIAGQNFGNPHDSTCTQLLRFSEDACNSMDGQLPPFTGTFRPESSFSNLYDSSSVQGNWKLIICDRASGDVGVLKHLSIDFKAENCPPPNNVFISAISSGSITFNLPAGSYDSIVVEAGPPGFIPNYPASPAVGAFQKSFDFLSAHYQLDGLINDTEYELYFYGKCSNDISVASCPYQVYTLCGSAIDWSGFDSLQLCPSDCDFNCPLGDGWFNVYSDDFDWIVAEGATPSPGTGPQSAYLGHGRYLLAESSSPDCQQNKTAVLQSECLRLNADFTECDLILHYHMSGEDVGTLKVEVSIDGGFEWHSLDSVSGEQGDLWKRKQVDLRGLFGEHFTLRIVAEMGDGELGDIGLDAISYSAAVQKQDATIYYRDMDEDGFGVDTQILVRCTDLAPDFYSLIPGDCNDDDNDINPDAIEISCNLLDENCNGMSDDSLGAGYLITPHIIQHATCSGAENGIISLEVIGGIPPYTFLWSNGRTDSLLTNLGEGAYSCIVADQSGCKQLSPIVLVNATQVLNYTVLIKEDPHCSHSEDGQIQIGVSGDTTQVNVSWSNGENGFYIDSLNPGTYFATIEDNNGCLLVSEAITLASSNGPEINFIISNPPSCHNTMDGALSPQVTGGTAPYKYRWSTGDTVRFLTGLSPGEYSLTVEDAVGCLVQKESIKVEEVDSIYLIINTLDNPTCYNTLDGQIQIHILGGTPPYSTFWSDGINTIISNDLLDVGPGTYSVNIQDFNNCTFSKDSIILEAPDTLQVLLDSIINVSCGLRTDGKIAISTIPDNEINILWNSGVINQNVLEDLASGFYRCTISDRLGCKNQSEVFEVSNDYLALPSSLTLQTPVSCTGFENAEVRATIADAFPPIIFQWEDGFIQQSTHPIIDRDGLATGNYWFLASDSLMCMTDTAFITIDDPTPLEIQLDSILDPACLGDLNGAIWMSVSGGTIPYTYNWNHGDTLEDALGLAAGNYQLSVLDSFECIILSDEIELIDFDSFYYDSRVLQVSDDPKLYELRIFPEGGLPPYTIDWQADSLLDNSFTADSLRTAWYTFTLKDDAGCLILDSVAVGISGTEETENDLKSLLYPNPASSVVFMKNVKDVKQIEVYNTFGKRMLNLQLPPAQDYPIISIDISHLTPGLYYVHSHQETNIHLDLLIVY